MTTTQEKVPDKFWPELQYPLSLKDALSTLSKQQLTSIRMNLQISNLSTLNKQGLVEKLAEKIPDHIETGARFWDINRLKLVQKIAKNEGLLDKPMLENQQYEYFRERGILFPGTVDGKRIVMMPSELATVFKLADRFDDHAVYAQNTECIRLSRGLLYYYGALTLDEMTELYNTHSDVQYTPAAMLDMMIDASRYEGQIEIHIGNVIADSRVTNPLGIIKERSLRHELDFCPFTKQELLKAGEADFSDKNSPYMNLFRYVIHHYEIDRDEADKLVQECVYAAKNGRSLAEVIDVAQVFIELPTIETLSAVTDLLVKLMNSTKQWSIKGYAPEELSAKRASASMVLNQTMTQSAASSDTIDSGTKKKVGRNDPCSCGSGKKFKKCCG